MKKFAAMVFCAMILLSGCGNNAQQKAEEVKQDATQTVEEVKQEAKQTADEVKQELKQNAEEVQTTVVQTALEMLDATKSLFKDSREIPLAGVLPGISLEKLIQAFGEPISRDGDDVTFGNGMQIDLDSIKNIVEKIIISTPDIATPEGVSVGMEDTVLNTAYGPADKVEIDRDDGEVEYKYFSRDNKKSITFTTRNAIITKIESELRD